MLPERDFCPVMQTCHLLTDEELARRQQNELDYHTRRQQFDDMRRQRIEQIINEFSRLGIISYFQQLIDKQTIYFNDQDGHKYSANNFVRPLSSDDIIITERGVFLTLGIGLRGFSEDNLGYYHGEKSFLAVGVQKIQDKYWVGFFTSPIENRLVFDRQITGFDIPFIHELETKPSTPENLIENLKSAVKTYQNKLEASRI